MNFSHFTDFLTKLENLNSRTEMTVITAEFLKGLDSESAKQVLYLLQGRLAPKYIPIEFNFSLKLIIKALSTLFPEEKVVEIYKSKGDVGLLVQEVLENYDSLKNPTQSLLEKEKSYNPKENKVSEIFFELTTIANANGSGSQDTKINTFLDIILKSFPNDAKYISRIIVGSLRLGMSDKTLLDAMSWSVTANKSLRKTLDTAFGHRADVGELALILVENNFKNVEQELLNIKLLPGTPVASKLVEREATSNGVWERMPNCFVQPKLDGLRGQIHYDSKKGIVEIFSRNMENMTLQYPEITESLKNLGVDSIILDSEIIGFNNDTEEYSRFQDTMKRKRKYGVAEMQSEIPVKAMCFDCLYLNGKDLTREPLEHRLEVLKSTLANKTEALAILESKQMNSESELEEYFKSNVESGLEGIITKEVGSDYEPGTRNFKWIKLKANTRSDLVDTIDVAVVGYYIGRGGRSKFGFGALLAAVYNPEDEKFYSIGKVGSGFTEEQMEQMFKDMSPLITKDMPENYVVSKSLTPDVWVKPNIVMEIDADEITRSPNHTAAINIPSSVENDDSSKGLSVRFPRMKKWKRDKDLPNTVAEIIRMYELRKSKA